MPRYRVTLESRSNPTIRRQTVVVKQSARLLIKRMASETAALAVSTGLPWDDFNWTVERYSGHLAEWQIVSHNRPGPRVTHA